MVGRDEKGARGGRDDPLIYDFGQFAEIDTETSDGQKIKAVVIADPSGSASLRWMMGLGRFGQLEARKVAGESAQLAELDPLAGFYDQYAVVEPPVLPWYYVELYRRDPSHRACIDAKTQAVALQGWRIRPRRELWPGTDIGGSEPRNQAEQDFSVHDAIVAVFEAGLPDYSFSDMLGAVYMDYCCTGNGWMEVIRDAKGKLARFAWAKSVTMRIARYVPGYVQVRGGNKRWFAKYGYDYRSVTLRRTNRAATDRLSLQQNPLFVPRAFNRAGEVNRIETSYDPWVLGKAAQNPGDEIAVPVNEIIHFANPSPKDTPYGEPAILSAIEDYLIAQNVRLFVLSYFENATVPRCAIFVKGDGSLNQRTLQVIDGWLRSQNKLDALNQMMIVEVPSDSQIQVERLSSEQLREDSGLLRPRDEADRNIYKVHRVPPSIVFDMVGLNNAVSEEADRKFIEFVVRPEQRMLEQRFNAVIEREFNSRDWVLDLMMPDLTLMQERRELWRMPLTRGVISINDVRRELKMPEIPGGEQPILLVPGQGYVPISAFSDPDNVKEMLDRARDAMQSGNVKTPPQSGGTGAEPVEAIFVPQPAVTAELPTALQVALSHIVEQFGPANIDDVKYGFPAAYPNCDNSTKV